MILTCEHITKEIQLTDGYTLVKFQHGKEFEIKIVEDSYGRYLIIDNDFISKKPLKLSEYIVLCKDIILKLEDGISIDKLSM